jgi:thymidylate kinase
LIVEFIGSTGAGKTTLINDVQRRLARSRQVTTSSDLVTSLVGLQGIKNTTTRNLAQEIVGLPFFLRSFNRYKDFITFSIRMFSRNSNLSIKTINNLRSIERKLGGYEISKRYKQDLIILVDEGPILTAHMFAYNDINLSQLEIEKFTSLLPLPDLIIYIRVPVETLIERSISRKNPPREMNSRNRSENENYIKRVISIFDRIVENKKIQSRLLIVDNSIFYEQKCDTLLDHITNFIIDFETRQN